MNALAGTGKLIGLALRRDRYVLALWIIALAAFMLGTTHMSVTGFPTQHELDVQTRQWATMPALRLMSLASGATIGSYSMVRSGITIMVLAAVMSVLCVVRHTRQNEETGRAELFLAGVIGQAAPVAAAVTVAVAADVVLAGALALSMIVNGLPVEGSLVAGASMAAVGVAFAGVAALTSQLSSTARGAGGLAMAALGIAFVLAGAGNMLGHADATGYVAEAAWPSLLSPIGWAQQMRPFGGDHWWLLALPVALCATAAAVACVYAARRDLGRGLLPVRAGRERAGRSLRGPLGLAWRLQRPAFTGWLAAVVCAGLVFGSISGTATSAEGQGRAWYDKLSGGGDLLDAFFMSFVQMAGFLAAVYVVQVLLRMREEESRGRLEAILSESVTRRRWMTSYLLTAGLGAAALLLGFAVPMALTAGLVLGGTQALLGELTAAALTQLPAIVLIMAVVVALVALVPRWAAPASWLVVTAAIVLSPVFGLSLSLPQWALDISPFTHQKAPAASLALVALAVTLAVAVAAGAAGYAAFRRRDLTA